MCIDLQVDLKIKDKWMNIIHTSECRWKHWGNVNIIQSTINYVRPVGQPWHTVEEYIIAFTLRVAGYLN